MNDTDRIYQLFAEANPAPASSVPTTERPDAAVILREQRTPTMLTREPRILEPPSTPRLRRWRGPAISLASFISTSVPRSAAVCRAQNATAGSSYASDRGA